MKKNILRIWRLRPVSRYLAIIDMTAYKQGDPNISEMRWRRYQLVVNSVKWHLWKNIEKELM